MAEKIINEEYLEIVSGGRTFLESELGEKPTIELVTKDGGKEPCQPDFDKQKIMWDRSHHGHH